MSLIQAQGKQKQEDHKVETSLDHTPNPRKKGGGGGRGNHVTAKAWRSQPHKTPSKAQQLCKAQLCKQSGHVHSENSERTARLRPWSAADWVSQAERKEVSSEVQQRALAGSDLAELVLFYSPQKVALQRKTFTKGKQKWSGGDQANSSVL